MMINSGFIRAPMYLLVSLALTLTSCGRESGGMPPVNSGVGQVRQVGGEHGRTAVLRNISITPSNPVGISSGAELQFTAMGFYSNNAVEDITTLVFWTTSDPSVTTVSNEAGSMGLATAVSRGYCSISATLGRVSSSTIIGVN